MEAAKTEGIGEGYTFIARSDSALSTEENHENKEHITLLADITVTKDPNIISYAKAMRSNEAAQWRAAIQEEL